MSKRRQPPNAAERRVEGGLGKAIAAAAVIALAAFVVYAPAFRGPFFFDDVPSIRDNPSIRSLIPISGPLNPPDNTSVSGRPLVNLTLAMNVAVNAWFGIAAPPSTDPNLTTTFHVVNVVLHLLCGLLLFLVLRRCLGEQRSPLLAGAITAIWLLHPIQTEAVDYIVQRTELLVSACYLGALYAAIRAYAATTSRGRAGWFTATCVSAFLGATSKEVIVTLPAVLVLYDRAFHYESWSLLWRDRRRVGLYVATAAIIGLTLVSIGAGGRAGTAGFASGMPWYVYAYTQAWAVAHYLRLIVAPIGLNVDYGERAIGGISAFVGAIVVASAIAATIIVWRRGLHRIAFAGVAFFIILIPSSSIIPIRTEVAAERRVYLASASVIALVVLAALTGLRRLTRTRSAVPSTKGAALVFGAVALVLGVSTAVRSAAYGDMERLWRGSVARMPQNPRAHDNLAYWILAADSTRTHDAEHELQAALRADSSYLPAWTNLADIEIRTGHTREAQALLERALAREPRYIEAQERLGELLIKTGDHARALTLLEPVAAARPTDKSLLSLGALYIEAGRTDDALRVVRQGVAINPRRLDGLTYAGGVLLERGQADEALPYLESAVRLGDRSRATLAMLSLSYAELTRPDESMRAAISAGNAGADGSADLLLGRAMRLTGRLGEAETFFRSAAAAMPANPEPVTRLALVQAARGDLRGAERALSAIVAKWPTYEPATQALAQVRGGGR